MITRYSTKSWGDTILLTLFFGIFGIHRFFVGKTVSGILYFFTLGFMGIGVFIDLLSLLTNQFTDNTGAIVSRDAKFFNVKTPIHPHTVGSNTTLSNQPKLLNTEHVETVNDLLFRIDGMDGHDFEYFCADLLRKNGFSDVRVTKSSGDQGVDILATKEEIKYAIQCKNYASPLGNSPVQEVSAGKLFYKCHVGVVLTNTTFTPGAIALAQATGVLLWNRNSLINLINKSQNPTKVSNTLPVVVPQSQPISKVEHPVLPETVSPTEAIQPVAAQTSPPSTPQLQHITIDNIAIDVDTTSANQYGIVIDNFGIDIDEENPDFIELLFDITSKNGRSIRCDISIVCNLYAGHRKVKTERENVLSDSFSKRNSVNVYFSKKNITKSATRIEIYCQEW